MPQLVNREFRLGGNERFSIRGEDLLYQRLHWRASLFSTRTHSRTRPENAGEAEKKEKGISVFSIFGTYA